MTTSAPSSTATPILDRLEPLPRLRGPQRLQITTWSIIGGVLVGTILPFLNLRGWLTPLDRALRTFVFRVDDVGIVQFTVITTLALLMVIAIHEAGHALAGALLGFKVHSIRIWRFQLNFPLKFSFYRGPSGGAGGWAICTPVTTDALATRAGVMLAAGPGANLLTALLVYPLPRSSDLLPVTFMVWSIVLGLINLMPIRTGLLFSDGYRIVMLLFDRARGQRWLALVTLSKDLLDGVPPESFPAEFLRVATAIDDESSDTVSAHSLAYSSAFRAGRYDEAGAHLERCLRYSGRTSKPLQHALMADAAVFQGRARRDATLAQAWLDDMPAKPQVPWHRLWAEAGVLHARGDRDALTAKLDAIEREIRKLSSPYQKFTLGAVERWRRDVAPHASQSESVRAKRPNEERTSESE